MTTYFVNGEFCEEPRVSALDLGILRSFGVFDYIQSYGGLLFHPQDHLERLAWSAKQIGLQMPYSRKALLEITQEIVERNEKRDAGIRLVVTGGLSSHDHLLPTGRASLMVYFHPNDPQPDDAYSDGLRVVTNRHQRFLPTVKTTNYLPAIFGMRSAKERGFDDAIYLNSDDELLECTTSNAFFFKDGHWITSKEVVHGVTRKIFLSLLEEPVEFRSLKLSEWPECEEAFLTSSVKDAVPLVQIDDQSIGQPGARTADLTEKFRSYLERYFEHADQNRFERHLLHRSGGRLHTTTP
ncbi:MAG: D-alanine aminotransferase [Chlamydiales bacterium]|nr:D-alanine aminotransferase [Chlamydiales bacterium]MCH9636072.1 D-alanine aminotransferase [Chlamydiales bacterium]MCH9703217.1 aminotransferase class IV [Chlamydiota bacterium]